MRSFIVKQVGSGGSGFQIWFVRAISSEQALAKLELSPGIGVSVSDVTEVEVFEVVDYVSESYEG
jgi:hypothetical protein